MLNKELYTFNKLSQACNLPDNSELDQGTKKTEGLVSAMSQI